MHRNLASILFASALVALTALLVWQSVQPAAPSWPLAVLAPALVLAAWGWRRWHSLTTVPAGLAMTLVCAAVQYQAHGALYVVPVSMLVLSLMPQLGHMGLTVACALVTVGMTPVLSLLGVAEALSWTLLAPMLAHALVLVVRTRDLAQQAGENSDIAFLVRAMGAQGPIRLNLSAVKAETELGGRLRDLQDRMAAALRQARMVSLDVQMAASEQIGRAHV